MVLFSGTQRSSSVLIVSALFASTAVAWLTMRRRTRKKAMEICAIADKLVEEGPLVKYSDVQLRLKILNTAISRALKHHLRFDEARVMESQVGGFASKSKNKKRMMSIPPDFALKSIHGDEKGFREIAFYESMRSAHHNEAAIARLLCIERLCLKHFNDEAFPPGRAWNQNYTDILTEPNFIDHVIMQCATFIKDDVLSEVQTRIREILEEFGDEIKLLRRLSSFTPDYYGVVRQKNPALNEISSDSCILFNDLTSNFSKPCVLDIKMSTKSYEPGAPISKKEREIKKYKLQDKIGFRIVGMRWYSKESGFVFFDKHFGRSLNTIEAVFFALRLFFGHHNDANCLMGIEEIRSPSSVNEFWLRELERKSHDLSSIRKDVVDQVLDQLLCIRSWFEDNDRFLFRSSSLLVIFEGDANRPNNAVVKMIDFCHVQRRKQIDDGYLKGLQYLVQLLNDIIEKDKEY